MIYLGIDNGIAGGLAAYNSETNEVQTITMPIVRGEKGRNEYDIPKIIEWFNNLGDIRMVILEKAQPYPGIGATAVFTNGRNYGIMEGILVARKLSYMVIHPKTWQKKMFEGMAYDDTKKASITTAKRLFPGASFVAKGSSIDHHGMTDAALMAYHGYLLHK